MPDNELRLFQIAQELTDKHFGKGTYVRLNRFDPSRGEMLPTQASAEGDGMAKASATDAETPGEHAESPSSKEKGSDGG